MLESERGVLSFILKWESMSRHSRSMPKMKRKRQSGTSVRRKKRVSISIVGAGRVGSALGIALGRAGYQIDLIVAKHGSHAKRAVAQIGTSTIGLSTTEFRRLTGTHRDLFSQSSLVIIATPDDVIGSVANELVAIFGRIAPNRNASPRPRVIMHTSGALSSEVLRPLQREGFAIGSIHPLISISDPVSGADWLTRAFFLLEGDAAAIRSGKQVVRDLGGHNFTIKADVKGLYHAAALMASPNMTALFDIALEMLVRCGLTRTRARQILLPLVRSTLDNLGAHDPAQALTGTFKRGDIATVKKHLAAIKSQNLDEALEAYVLLGKRSLSLADQTGSTNQIQRLLTRAARRHRR
jgi:predicted short-subunit dehydrogenase-like oxidoreductase (DUF2520 family)